jgi:hypothetical protein
MSIVWGAAFSYSLDKCLEPNTSTTTTTEATTTETTTTETTTTETEAIVPA